jgi:hypothetical protein
MIYAENFSNDFNKTSLWSWRSTRLYIALLLMFVIFCLITMRDNMGIAVVCMVNTTSSSTSTHTHIGLDNYDRGNMSENSNFPKCKKWSIYSENYTETSVSKVKFIFYFSILVFLKFL